MKQLLFILMLVSTVCVAQKHDTIYVVKERKPIKIKADIFVGIGGFTQYHLYNGSNTLHDGYGYFGKVGVAFFISNHFNLSFDIGHSDNPYMEMSSQSKYWQLSADLIYKIKFIRAHFGITNNISEFNDKNGNSYNLGLGGAINNIDIIGGVRLYSKSLIYEGIAHFEGDPHNYKDYYIALYYHFKKPHKHKSA